MSVASPHSLAPRPLRLSRCDEGTAFANMCTIPLAMMRLIMFTAVFCIIFVDRGGWAVALNRVENDFDLSNLQVPLPSLCFSSL